MNTETTHYYLAGITGICFGGGFPDPKWIGSRDDIGVEPLSKGPSETDFFEAGWKIRHIIVQINTLGVMLTDRKMIF